MFNEDTRVKIPAILHLCRLGYHYLPLSQASWDKETNIFKEIFTESILRINDGHCTEEEVHRLYDDLSLDLENEDLGRAFYKRLLSSADIRLVDFDDFDRNSFHVVTELACVKDDEEYRPDITLLVNGMPLAFIEVKKPNNREGILAERNRMEKRLANKKFRKFINQTQLMVFSNNMEYDDGDVEPLQGAYYTTTAYGRPGFNYFREEDERYQQPVLPSISVELENLVLSDNNLVSIKNSKEFDTNKHPNSPTNRICTSLFSRERLKFILRYAIVYLDEQNGVQKHIMRYPQLFASKAIVNLLEQGIKKGIIWHTQGSGKTALAYYAVHLLTDYYRSQSIVPKFYFIVDRLDLLVQASREFEARGLKVNQISSKEAFAEEIKSSSALHNSSGKREITVVNIQKFKDDPDVVRNTDYQVSMQRVYFLDEVHRSYNPKGSFLANLKESDPNAVKIGLTGTPLLGDEYNSKDLFGNYIHKYYYNASIKDGYTLRLIREEIETRYKLEMEKTLEEIKILKGEGDRKLVYAHPKFAEPMLDYIIDDFENARLRFDEPSIGGMIVCDSSDQAKEMHRIFQEKYAEPIALQMAAEDPTDYGFKKKYKNKVKTAALILHDVGTKREREVEVEQFKSGKIDLLFVYNMLLTGFDAPRLKKLYIGRVIKSHNLLQTLTRVNRTYHEFRYGYVVDFADIESEFDKTNKAYFDELQAELGDDLEHYSDLFLQPEEIEEGIQRIKEVLFRFDTENAELFNSQISEIEDRGEMLKITKALNSAKALYNLIRLTGNYDMLEKLDFRTLNRLSTIAQDHLALINQRDALHTGSDSANLLNVALEDVIFAFAKVKEEEMVLADELKNALRKTREMLAGNFDKHSPEFISLKEELERLFKKKNLNEVDKADMQENIQSLNSIYEKAKEDLRKNKLLLAKYANDQKYARIHKRLLEKGEPTDSEMKLFEALNDLKLAADEVILNNSNALANEAYIEKMITRNIIEQFNGKHHIQLSPESTRLINQLVVKEYMNEYHGRAA